PCPGSAAVSRDSAGTMAGRELSTEHASHGNAGWPDLPQCLSGGSLCSSREKRGLALRGFGGDPALSTLARVGQLGSIYIGLEIQLSVSCGRDRNSGVDLEKEPVWPAFVAFHGGLRFALFGIDQS